MVILVGLSSYYIHRTWQAVGLKDLEKGRNNIPGSRKRISKRITVKLTWAVKEKCVSILPTHKLWGVVLCTKSTAVGFQRRQQNQKEELVDCHLNCYLLNLVSDDVFKLKWCISAWSAEARMLWLHFTAHSNSSASSYAPLLPLPAYSLISSPSSHPIPPWSLLFHLLFLFLLHLLLPEHQTYSLYKPQ